MTQTDLLNFFILSNFKRMGKLLNPIISLHLAKYGHGSRFKKRQYTIFRLFLFFYLHGAPLPKAIIFEHFPGTGVFLSILVRSGWLKYTYPSKRYILTQRGEYLVKDCIKKIEEESRKFKAAGLPYRITG